MPRNRYVRAVATKASVASLWAAAEAQGEITIYTASEHSCRLIRNKLYAHRARLRKSNQATTGLEVSTLDGYSISYGHDPERKTDPWHLTIGAEDIVEFSVEVDLDLPAVHFDALDPDVPQAPMGEFAPDPLADYDLTHGDDVYEIFKKTP